MMGQPVLGPEVDVEHVTLEMIQKGGGLELELQRGTQVLGHSLYG